nr:ATP-binding protein [Pyrinomonadaceae bacterium]
ATLSVQLNDLNKIVESVAALVENQEKSQSVKIKKDLQKNLPEVLIDSEQIKQVFLNLAINSLQAMPDGGQIAFRTSENGRYCMVEVKDSGAGIDPKFIPKIFDPFFTTKEKGVGLGLSIARKIVNQHEGTLSIANDSGKTVFSLHLPKNT